MSSRSKPNCSARSRLSKRKRIDSPFTVGMVETRTSMFLVVGLQIDAAVLRQAALGDVHVRHDFQARDDGRLQHAQLRRHRDFVQDAVDAVTNAQIVLQRLDVNIRGALDDRFADDLVDELDDATLPDRPR